MLKKFVESSKFRNFIVLLIILNAITLGLECYPSMVSSFGLLLNILDTIFTILFVLEITLEIIALRKQFFTDPWHLFDFIVVSLSLIPAGQAFTIFRVLRILRVLRLISMVPSLRRVVQGLISAIPGIGSIAGILLLLFYVFGVMATRLYGQDFPNYFGTLQASLFSLFQIMTLEGWPDIVRSVMEKHPLSWLFFVVYILIATFSVLNLFIAVIVDAMQKQHDIEEKDEEKTLKKIQRELEAIRRQITNNAN